MAQLPEFLPDPDGYKEPPHDPNYDEEKLIEESERQEQELKEWRKAYYQRPDIKARRKAYYQRPDIKARHKKYMQEYNKTYKRPRPRRSAKCETS